MQLYERLDIYSYDDNGGLKIYRCFKCTINQTYYVQNADFYTSRKDYFRRFLEDEGQIAELFMDTEPSKRISGFVSVNEAVESFEAEFNDPN